jgi:hypothetical protein
VSEIKLNQAGLTAFRNSPEIAALVARVADRVASNAESLAGTATASGQPVQIEMRRTSYDTGRPLNDPPRNRSRARAAVLVSHPTPTGRERGMRGLLSALDAGVGL